MLTSKKLGEKIKNLRTALNLNQNEFAKKLDLSRVTIAQIESGQRTVSALDLMKIGEIFNIDIDTFLQDETPVTATKNKEENIVFNPSKLRNVILYILEKCGGKPNIGETVLYKLLYFIDFDAYEKTGKPITGLSYVKLQFGPVPKADEYHQVLDEMKAKNELKIFEQLYHQMHQKRYVALTNTDMSLFNGEEIKIMDSVITKLSDMQAKQITEYAHGDVPWIVAENKKLIPYQLVFEREKPYTEHDYEEEFQNASAQDISDDLGEVSEEEHNYYM